MDHRYRRLLYFFQFEGSLLKSFFCKQFVLRFQNLVKNYKNVINQLEES